VELDSSFEVGALVVAGQRLPLSILAPDQRASLASVGAALLQQLSQQGLTIDLLPEERTERSITSAGLRIRMVTETPELPPLPPLPDLGLPPLPALPTILALPGGL